MSDFPNEPKKLAQSVSDLAQKIPGFKGYLALAERREADVQLRERLAQALVELQVKFTTVQKDLISNSGLTYMEMTQGIDTNLQTFIDRITTAPRGYSSFFASDKIDEKALEAIYHFDNSLFGIVDRIAGLVSSLTETIGTDATGQVLKELYQEILTANETFKHREELITESAQ